MECVQPEEADSMGMSVLIYIVVFYIWAEETVVMECART